MVWFDGTTFAQIGGKKFNNISKKEKWFPMLGSFYRVVRSDLELMQNFGYNQTSIYGTNLTVKNQASIYGTRLICEESYQESFKK